MKAYVESYQSSIKEHESISSEDTPSEKINDPEEFKNVFASDIEEEKKEWDHFFSKISFKIINFYFFSFKKHSQKMAFF